MKPTEAYRRASHAGPAIGVPPSWSLTFLLLLWFIEEGKTKSNMSVLETNSCEHHLQLNGRKYSVYLFIIYFDFLIISPDEM